MKFRCERDVLVEALATATRAVTSRGGALLKEGLSRDWSNRKKIADLLLFESLKTEKGK